MGYYKYRPSKAARAEFAEKMAEIDAFCADNGISASLSKDSYYFTLNGKRYRVSNHTINTSNRAAFNELGEQVREVYHDEPDDELICITASKLRIIDIYNALKAGRTLDKRGNIVK